MTSKKNAETVAVEAEEPVKGIFAQIEAEALEEYEPKAPFVINDVEPPIVITEPVETERVVSLAVLYNSGREFGQIDPKDFDPLLRAVCGDAYDRVWNELLRGKHLRVAYAFMQAVQKHFRPQGPAAGKSGAADVPGGSPAS